MASMARGARTTAKPETEWIVSMLRGKRAERLGAVRAPDMDAAIARAIEELGITDFERQRRVIVRPIADSWRAFPSTLVLTHLGRHDGDIRPGAPTL